jgi:hypothetical protein
MHKVVLEIQVAAVTAVREVVETCDLCEPTPGVNEETDDRRISARLKVGACAGGKECGELRIGEDRGWLLYDAWLAHLAHRRVRNQAFTDRPLKELLQGAEAMGGRAARAS